MRRKCEERLNDKCFNTLFSRVKIFTATPNLFKTMVNLNYEVCSYLAVDTLHLDCRIKFVEDAQGNNRCFF